MIIVDTSAFCQTNLQKTISFSRLSLGNNSSYAIPNMRFSIAGDFSVKRFGFFCRQEMKVEKISGIPIKLRIGSLRHNDWLEGKTVPGFYYPGLNNQ